MNRDEASALYDSEFWEDMTPQAMAEFQLHEERLCMPFGVFHEAVEKTLKRPVWSHEFAFMEKLQEELRGDRPRPTMQQILDLIPPEKRVVIMAAPAEVQP